VGLIKKGIEMNDLYNVEKNGKVILRNKPEEECDHYVMFNANREGCKVVPA